MISRIKYAAFGIPALLFFSEVLRHLQNIPTMDDYDIILDFLNRYIVADPMEKLGMIFGQYSEHRLVPSKLLYVGYYYLSGSTNFRILGILGDLQLIPVSLIGVYFIRKAQERWFWPAMAWMLVVFDLNTYENACMTMNAVGNYGVICYFFCALYFYERKQYVWAILFQTLCIGSNANGVMAAVLLLATYSLYWFDKNRKDNDGKKSDFRRWMICLVVDAVLIPCYFINYESVSMPNALPFDAGRDLIYLVKMIGAPLSFNLSLYYGLLIIGLLLFLFPYKTSFRQPNLPLTTILFFAGGTIVLAALFRAGYSDAQFQTSRYLIYPQMFLGILGCYAWRRLSSLPKSPRTRSSALPKAPWARFSIPAAFILIYLGNYHQGEAGFIRTEIRAQTLQFWHPQPASCTRICAESCSREIYCIDENRDYVPPRKYYIIPRRTMQPRYYAQPRYIPVPKPTGQP